MTGKFRILLLFLSTTLPILFCSNSKTNSTIQTFKVKRGDFVSTVMETGELQAVHSKLIYGPMISRRSGNLKITDIVDDGTAVKKGDILIEFDKAEVQQTIIEVKGRL